MFTLSLLGKLLVLAALFLAAAGSAAGFVAGSQRNNRAWEFARNSAYGFSIAMLLSNLVMIYALCTNDFSVKYVAEVGSIDTPRYISVISLWSSLNGSILFWGGILGVYTAVAVWSLGDKHREFTPWAVHVLLAIGVFFALLVATVANPFEALPNPPADGPGPNPLLQNHWLMAVHPPMLYLGYVGMSVPFSLICAALLAGRFEAGWMGPVRRWMMVPWAFLSLAIMLGGWWSYEVLGWGGAWAWDPVENASFHPWLTGTAFLHSAMVLQRRGRMRDWTLVLGMATFLLTLLGTFMTRSGVFNSVHSFTQSEIGPVFLVFIGIVLVYSLLLLSFRSHLLDEHAQRVDAELGSRSYGVQSSFLSREFAIMLQNGLFTLFTFTVLLGTLYPLIMEGLDDKRLSVGEPYFNYFARPVSLSLVFMMGVGPALPWGRIDSELARKRLQPAVLLGLGFAALSWFGGFQNFWTLIAMITIGFALWCNLYEFVEPVLQRMRARSETFGIATTKVWGRARRRLGGHIAHYGVLLAVFALTMSKGYRVEQDSTLTKGQNVSFAGYDVTYTGYERQDLKFRDSEIANFEVRKDGVVQGTFGPRMNHYPTQREPVVTPVVWQRATGDLYFSLIDLGNKGDTIVIRLIYQPFQMWLWFSGPVILIGTFIAAWPQQERRGAPASASMGNVAVPGGAK